MSAGGWGATPDDWAHFDMILGLGEDLLPVVSNPHAVVSERSKLKALGKTPSVYDRAGRVTGLSAWTSHRATPRDLTRWSAVSDYGICVQTRSVRALDIDIDDAALASAITEFVAERLGVSLPLRTRPGSAKCLMAFELPGDMPKRRIKVAEGVIEFLATGQQFIAVGTHPSGHKYEWVGGLPTEIPKIPLDIFEELWLELRERFGVDDAERDVMTTALRLSGPSVEVDDPVADYLRASGRVLGEERDGALVVECPWAHEHSTGEVGDGSTVWFPAGSRGYEMGHFKCLHGHCEGRGDHEFFEAIGFVEPTEFEVVSAKPEPLPAFVRDKSGRIEATIDNVTLAVRRADFTGMAIRFDTFRDEIMWSAEPGQWVTFTDADYVRLRIRLERQGFKPIGRELIRDVVLFVASETAFDSAQAWLEGLMWDGVPRVERFLADYMGVDDSDYAKAVSRYMWTALAGRVVAPGVKADMVPIFVGAQGAGKSTAVAAIAPAPEFFAEVSFAEKDDDLSRKMRGRLVAEIGELRGLRSKELESIKAFITRTHENWIPKFREFATQFPRRLLFIGTTNRDEFLADETGNRRWLPVRVGVAKAVDVAGIRADRLQLWAEARDLFVLSGVDYNKAEELSADAHEEHTIRDTWEESVSRWVSAPDPITGEVPAAREFLRVSDILRDALNFADKQISRVDEMRVGAILRTLGYERKKMRIDGATRWVFVPSCSHLFPR